MPRDTLPSLVVICRRPRLGIGKQRLAAEIGADQALVAAELLLATAIEDANAWAGTVIVSPADAEDAVWAAGLCRRVASVLPQPSGNLGERLQGVDLAARRQGHQSLVYIGSDAPLLDATLYESACAALLRQDVVLARAEDGGVTLMATRKPWPPLGELPWSTSGLGIALAECCESAGRSVAWLPGGQDVDVLADLRRLAPILQHDCRPARRRLYTWLQSLT